MALRLSSELWVQAYLRQCRVEGAFGYLSNRGSQAAGAIFIKIVQGGGQVDLYGPAPQSMVTEEDLDHDSRLFELLLSGGEAEIDLRLVSERKFDPDVWIVEIEDAAGIHRLPLAAL